MHRLGIALSAAVVLSMVPLAPSVAAPVSSPTTIVNDAGSLVEVGYRYNKRRHYKRGYSSFGLHWYGGRKYYPRKVYRHGKRHHKYGYRKRGYRGYGNCVRIGGVKVCF